MNTGQSGHASAAAVPVVVGLAVVVLLVLRRTRGQELRTVRLFVLPGIVLVLGLAAILPQLSGRVPLHAIDYGALAADVALSLGTGVARGRSVVLYERDGSVWYRYGRATVLLWAGSIAARFLIGLGAARLGAVPLVASGSVLAMLGLSVLTQNSVLHRRFRRDLRAGPSRISGQAASG